MMTRSNVLDFDWQFRLHTARHHLKFYCVWDSFKTFIFSRCMSDYQYFRPKVEFRRRGRTSGGSCLIVSFDCLQINSISFISLSSSDLEIRTSELVGCSILYKVNSALSLVCARSLILSWICLNSFLRFLRGSEARTRFGKGNTRASPLVDEELFLFRGQPT